MLSLFLLAENEIEPGQRGMRAPPSPKQGMRAREIYQGRPKYLFSISSNDVLIIARPAWDGDERQKKVARNETRRFLERGAEHAPKARQAYRDFLLAIRSMGFSHSGRSRTI